MITYSYPFNNHTEYQDFWNCFDNVKETQVMDIQSHAMVSGKFCKASLYYIEGTFARKWRNIEPDGKIYTFQIGEQENVHGNFINCDLTDMLGRLGHCPLQFNVPKQIHMPSYPHTKEDSWPILWGMILGLRSFDKKNLESMGMANWWDSEEMNWVGPHTIGHCKTLKGFEDYHQRPFLRFVPDRTIDGSKNKVIFSDGSYAALMGHPSLIATHQGEYFGFEPEGGTPRMFVMDFYTSNNGKLVDNWIQIDMIDLFRSINLDYERKIDETLCYTR
jgi:predicted ester cyclase